MKKTVKYLLTVTAVITLIAALAVTSFATTEKTYDDGNGNIFKYTVGNGGVTITDCKSPNAEVVIPDTLDGLPVTVIGSSAFSLWDDYQNEEQGINRTLKSVKIPDTVQRIEWGAFECCVSLETFNIPRDLKVIASHAFSNTGIKTLYIPEGVAIKQYAFYECSSLTTAVIDGEPYADDFMEANGTGNWGGAGMFMDCTALREVTLSEQFTEICPEMFWGCTSLIKVNAPTVTKIGAYAFEDCASLTSFDFANIPDDKIYEGAFKGCTALKDLTNYRPAAVEKSVFENCTSLEYVDMSWLTTVETNAFAGCTALKSIDLTAVKKIGGFGFANCTSLKELNIPNTLSLYSGAFAGCTGLEKIIIGDECESLHASTRTGSFFRGCKNVKTVYIGKSFRDRVSEKSPVINATLLDLWELEGLEKIEVSTENPYYFSDDGVLYMNFQYESKVFADTVKEDIIVLVCYPAAKPGDSYSTRTALENIDKPFTIGYSAFRNSKTLKNLEISENVISPEFCADAGYMSFYESSVEKISFLEGGIEYIEEDMFYRSQIRDFDFTGTKWIGESAFEECQNLSGELYIPNCTYVDNYAFKNCHNIEIVNMPKCEDLCHETFFGCENIKKVILPNCESIGNSNFKNAVKLTEAEIGNCYIGDYAFYNCTALTDINLKNCKGVGKYAFYNCTGLTDIDLGNCKGVGECGFYNCTGLSDVDLHSCVNIGREAFYGCKGFTRLNLLSAKYIGVDAFANCTELCFAEFGQNDCDIAYDAFRNDNKLEFCCDEQSTAYKYAIENKIPFCAVEVNIATDDLQYTGNEIRPGVIVRISEMTLVQNKDYTLEFDNNVEVGTATVTIRFIGDFDGLPDAVRTFYITGRDITNGVAIEYVEDQVYSGEEIRPEVVVKYNGKTLTEGEDYDLRYYQGSGSQTGTMYFTVYGRGHYVGKVDCYYNIIRRDIAEAELDKIPDCTYTGSEICPEPTLTWNGFTLIKDVDYEVRYFENVNTGFATMVIYGKGNFCGTLKIQYRIFGKNIETAVVSEVPDKEYTGGAITPDVTVTFDGKTLTNGVDYTVEYKNNTESGTASIVINGIGNYSGTKTQTFRIYKNSVYSFTVFSETEMTATYDGTALKPEMEVYFGETLLKEGVDYTVKLINNVNAGTATVTICGIGKFEGERSFDFTILPCTVNENDISVSGDMEYSGTAVEPNITVTKDGKVLENGTDYTVTYENNDAVGTAYMTVTGIGNYQGDVEIEYEIYAPEAPEEPETPKTPEPPVAPDDNKKPTVPEKEQEKNENVVIPNTGLDENKKETIIFFIAVMPVLLIMNIIGDKIRRKLGKKTFIDKVKDNLNNA